MLPTGRRPRLVTSCARASRLSPDALGLSHPALSQLTNLRSLHTTWRYDAAASAANLAPLLLLTSLGAGSLVWRPFLTRSAAAAMLPLRGVVALACQRLLACGCEASPTAAELQPLFPSLRQLLLDPAYGEPMVGRWGGGSRGLPMCAGGAGGQEAGGGGGRGHL